MRVEGFMGEGAMFKDVCVEEGMKGGRGMGTRGGGEGLGKRISERSKTAPSGGTLIFLNPNPTKASADVKRRLQADGPEGLDGVGGMVIVSGLTE